MADTRLFGVTTSDPFGFADADFKLTSVSQASSLDPVIVSDEVGEYVTGSQKAVNERVSISATYQCCTLNNSIQKSITFGGATEVALDGITVSARAGQHLTVSISGHRHVGGENSNKHNAASRTIVLPTLQGFGAQNFGLTGIGVPVRALQSSTLQINIGHTDDTTNEGNFLCGTTHGVSASASFEAIDPTSWGNVTNWIKTADTFGDGTQTNSSHQSRTATYTQYFNGPQSGGGNISMRGIRALKPKTLTVSRVYRCRLMDPNTLEGPQIASESDFSAFSSVSGTPGEDQILYVEGEELEEALVISCPTGYEASLDGSEWTDELEIEPQNGEVIANVRIRLAASASAGNSASATVSGSIEVSCGDADDFAVPVTGTVTHGPALTVTGTLSAFSATAGTASEAQSFTFTGQYLTDGVSVAAPYGLEVSKDGEIFAGSVSFAMDSGSASGTVYVRVAEYAEAGTIADGVQVASDGAQTRTVAASATVTHKPTVAISGASALALFAATEGTASAPKTVTVSGEHLTADLTATATGDFEVCKTADGTYAASASVTPDADHTAAFTLYVRVKSTAEEGTETGTLTVSSTGADSATAALSAEVEAAAAE